MKETLEEAAEHGLFNTNSRSAFEEGFIQGAKWQQERSYSEEEVKKAVIDAYHTNPQETKWKNIGINYYNETFKDGAKWQQERMYSETEVLQLLLRLQQTESYDNLHNWFEQFKKK